MLGTYNIYWFYLILLCSLLLADYAEFSMFAGCHQLHWLLLTRSMQVFH